MTPTTTGAGKAHDSGLSERLETARRDLAASTARVNRGAAIATVVVVALLLLGAGYSIYAYRTLSAWSEYTKPENVVARAAEYVDPQLPVWRADLEREVL